MYELLIWLAPPFILVLLLIKWSTGWAARAAGSKIEAKFRAAENLANQHTTPDAWLAPHRARLAGLQAQGAGESQITQALELARSDCLRRLDELIRYFAQGAFVDTVQTRDTLVKALQAERKRMEQENWRALLLSQPAAVTSQRAQGGTSATQSITQASSAASRAPTQNLG